MERVRTIGFLLSLACLSVPDAIGGQAGVAPARASEVIVVGTFANNDQGDPAQVPCIIELYRVDSKLFGMLYAAVVNEDMPAGLLEDVRYNSQTGEMSFRSRLTIGVVVMNGKTVPTEDLVEFSGTLTQTSLSGTAIWTRHDLPTLSPRQERVGLRYSARLSDQMLHSKSYAEFAILSGRVLQARGPKW